MTGALITLTTDFGTRDGYVGAMRGVILRQDPGANVVTITHDVPPYDIAAGAWALSNAWPLYPTDTIHVAVVDPGVGSARRSVLVRAGGQTFLGPDNGVIVAATAIVGMEAAREITSPEAQATDPSATFHGRDVFAWAAGWLASGHEWQTIGRELPTESLVCLPTDSPSIQTEQGQTVVHGVLRLSDGFGNIVTSVPRGTLAEAFGERAIRDLELDVHVGGADVRFGRAYADAPLGTAVAYIGSAGFLEIAVNRGSAAELYGPAASVRISAPVS